MEEEKVARVPKYALILNDLLSDYGLRCRSTTPNKEYQEKKFSLVYQAKKVDSARERLDHSLRDMHKCVSQVDKDIKKHDFLNHGKLVEAAFEVLTRESSFREEVAKFSGILHTEPELDSAFNKALWEEVLNNEELK